MTDGFSGRNVGSGGGGDGVGKRSLLASLWSIMTILTATCFLTAFLFVLSTNNDEYYNQNNNDNGYNNNNENDKEGGSQDEYNGGSGGNAQQVAVTSRALAFSILWTSVLAALLSVFGTVILGWQSPTGLYYTCCSSSVHRTTPLGIGSFIGALLMFANLTLVCSVLFGEFEILEDSSGDGYDRNGGGSANQYYGQRENKSIAFSYLCMVLTVLYGGFAALTLTYVTNFIDEVATDERTEITNGNIMMTSTNMMNFNAHNTGYDLEGYQ